MKSNNLKSRKESIESSSKKTVEQQKRKKLLALQGKVIWEGNLDEMRS